MLGKAVGVHGGEVTHRDIGVVCYRRQWHHGHELGHLLQALGPHHLLSLVVTLPTLARSSRAERVSTGVAAATARVAAFSWAETADIPDTERGCEAVSTPPGTWAVEGAAGGNVRGCATWYVIEGATGAA